MKPLSKEAVPYIFINGQPIKSEAAVTLQANDRIVFGTGSVFLFKHEEKAKSSPVQDTKENPITHEFAMKEKLDFENQAEAERRKAEREAQEAETAKKMQELADKMEAERKAKEAEHAALIAQFEAKMKAMQDEISTKQDDEVEKQKALDREANMRQAMMKQIEEEKVKAQKEEAARLERIQREEANIKNRQAQFSELEKKLSIVLPLINEANLISKELKRDITFQTKMIREMPDTQNLQEARTDVVIKVENREIGYYYQWSVDKFQNRLFMMRELLNQYFEDNVIP